jgi:hypothetical protein
MWKIKRTWVEFDPTTFFARIFYLPHMEYEVSIGIEPRKVKKKNCRFSRFRLFMAKKHNLSEKNLLSVSGAPL